MSTHGRIGVELPDGRVHSIYLGHDAYLSHTKPLLLGHYESQAKVIALIALGDLSGLGPELTGETDAYHRDHGEPLEDVKADEHENAQAFWSAAEEFYVFLFTRQEHAAKRTREAELLAFALDVVDGVIASYGESARPSWYTEARVLAPKVPPASRWLVSVRDAEPVSLLDAGEPAED